MRTVTAMELRKRLGEILDAASVGEPIAIERDGRPMAVLVTPEAAARLGEAEGDRIQRVLATLDRLEAFRARVAGSRGHPDDGPTTTEWVRSERESRHQPTRRPGPGEPSGRAGRARRAGQGGASG